MKTNLELIDVSAYMQRVWKHIAESGADVDLVANTLYTAIEDAQSNSATKDNSHEK